MPGHLILTVHGIGEQLPGETVDSVLGGAIADHERQPNPVSVAIENHEVLLPEHRFPTEGEAGQPHADLFPVHTRHVRPADNPADPGTHWAEVYWADKSPAPVGVFWTIFGVIKLLLGVGYLAMDNVENNGSRLSFIAVHGFTWCFFGGVAAVNALFLIGTVLLLFEGRLYGLEGMNSGEFVWVFSPEVVIWTAAACGVVIGILIEFRRASTYLNIVFGRGLILMGLLSPFMNNILQSARQGLEIEARSPIPDGLQAYIASVIEMMGLIWVLVMVFCFLAYLAWAIELSLEVIGKFLRSRQNARAEPDAGLDGTDDAAQAEHLDVPVTGQRRIYAPICAAMILLWMVFGSAFWLGVQYIVRTLSTPDVSKSDHTHEPSSLLLTAFEENLDTALGAMTVSTLFLIILVAVTLSLVWQRYQQRENLFEESDWPFGRLILNANFQVVFTLAFMGIVCVIIYLIDQGIDGTVDEANWIAQLVEELSHYKGFASLFLLGLAFMVYYFSGVVSGILGVARDIVAYATMRKCIWMANPDPDNYPLRIEIEHRFERVLKLMLRQVCPDRLTILSHSQGTVVATRCLARIIEEDPPCLPEKFGLITMGSPVTHLYRQYFTRDFNLSPKLVGETVTWINIFRTDDFVGTRIDLPAGMVENYHVPAGGHTGYFTDAAVWKILRDKAAIKLV